MLRGEHDELIFLVPSNKSMRISSAELAKRLNVERGRVFISSVLSKCLAVKWRRWRDVPLGSCGLEGFNSTAGRGGRCLREFSAKNE